MKCYVVCGGKSEYGMTPFEQDREDNKKMIRAEFTAVAFAFAILVLLSGVCLLYVC